MGAPLVNRLSCNDSARLTLTRHDAVCNGAISAGKTRFSHHLQKMLIVDSQGLMGSGLSSSNPWEYLCALEFMGAYEDFYNLARSRVEIRSEGSPRTPDPDHKDPYDLFLPGTPAFKTMSGSSLVYIKSIIPILLLNIMFLNQRDDCADDATFEYWSLRKKMLRCDVDLGSGVAFLCWAIGTTPDLKHWTNQSWMELLSRLLSVVVRLTDETKDALEKSLLGFVTASTVEEADSWCDPTNARAKIEQDLQLGCEMSLPASEHGWT